VLEVAAQHPDEPGVVEQHGSAPLAFAQDREVLVVGAQVEILDMNAERFACAQASRRDQREQQP
jgi:hypothetical protein